jgi:hypothetical protein
VEVTSRGKLISRRMEQRQGVHTHSAEANGGILSVQPRWSDERIHGGKRLELGLRASSLALPVDTYRHPLYGVHRDTNAPRARPARTLQSAQTEINQCESSATG